MYKWLSLLLFVMVYSGCSVFKKQNMVNNDGSFKVNRLTVLDSVAVHYEERGKGKQTILFIHGLGSNLKAFNKMAVGFENDYRCIAIDLPGYNGSSKGSYPFSMTFFAQVVEEFIAELGLKDVIIIGHSMGGHISIKIALNHNPAVKKLVLLAPAGFETFSEKESSFLNQVSTAKLFRSLTKEQILHNFYENFVDFPSDAQFMIDDRLEMAEDEMAYDYYCNMIPLCINGMLAEPVFNSLDEIAVPTLIIFGKEDRLIPNRYLHSTLTTIGVAESGHVKIDGSKLEMIEDAGHFFFWEKSDATHALIRNFLNQYNQ